LVGRLFGFFFVVIGRFFHKTSGHPVPDKSFLASLLRRTRFDSARWKNAPLGFVDEFLVSLMFMQNLYSFNGV
jgi:hypothetical protein